jgi:hypothetical protein
LPIGGLIQAGTSLVIGMNVPANIAYTVVGASIQDQQLTVIEDQTGELPKTDFVLQSDYIPSQAGTYTLAVTAIPNIPGSGVPITVTSRFLVVAPGGSNTQVRNNEAPYVLADQLLPKDGTTGVPITVFPQVTFSEPVHNVQANINLSLVDTADNVIIPVKLLGVGLTTDVNGNPTSTIQTFTNVGQSSAVTSVTLQPLAGLKFGVTYKIHLTSAIIDFDIDSNNKPAPKNLVSPFDFQFTIFKPEALPQTTEKFPAPRVVVLGSRLYTSKPESGGVNSDVLDFNTENPGNIFEVAGSRQFVLGRAADLAGQEVAPDTGKGLVALAIGAGILPLPSNIWLFDVSDPDRPKRVGAVSVTGSAAQEGSILRMVMKDSFIYTSTFQKGIQVVDIGQAKANYADAFTTPGGLVQFGAQISTDGQGFGQDAVVNTIPVLTTVFGPTPVNATLFDLKAADYVLNQGLPQTLVVATGIESLVVADPVAGTILSQQTTVSGPSGTLQRGFAVALGTISAPCPNSQGSDSGCNIAVIGGSSSGFTPIMMIVNMTDPSHPVPLSSIAPDDVVTDIVLKGNIVLVGSPTQVQMFDITDPTNPQKAGFITGIGGRLSIKGEYLYATGYGPVSITGVHAAILDPGLVATPIADSDLSIGYNFHPEGISETDLNSSTITITPNHTVLALSNNVDPQGFKSSLMLTPDQLKKMECYATARIRQKDPDQCVPDGDLSSRDFKLYFPKVPGSRDEYIVKLNLPGSSQIVLDDKAQPDIIVQLSQDDIDRREDAAARQFAPVFIQEGAARTNTHNGQAFEDYFLRVDFDGDWNTWNNVSHLQDADTKKYNLAGYVYFAVQETDFYYFLSYVYYHGTDPKRLGHHANDLEGGHVVVQKSDARVGSPQEAQAKIQGGPETPVKPGVANFGKPVAVMTQAHDSYTVETKDFVLATGEGATQPPTDLTQDSRTHSVISSQKGEGLATEAGHGAGIPDSSGYSSARGILYVPGDLANRAEVPQRIAGGGFAQSVHYQLIPVVGDKTSDNNGKQVLSGFWDRRRDDRIYGASDGFTLNPGSKTTLGHGLFGDKFFGFVPHCAANFPWGWKGRGLNKGERFLDPMNVIMNSRQPKLTSDTGNLVKEPRDGSHYVSNIFLKDVKFSGTFPAKDPPLFQDDCSCTTILAHIQSGVSRGLDDLPMGDSCK